MYTKSMGLFMGFSVVACNGDKAQNPSEPVNSGEPSSEIDSDGDGYSSDEDCDDTNASINPDAEEICDEVDNNCDGNIDEGVSTLFYVDTDEDGFDDEF